MPRFSTKTNEYRPLVRLVLGDVAGSRLFKALYRWILSAPMQAIPVCSCSLQRCLRRLPACDRFVTRPWCASRSAATRCIVACDADQPVIAAKMPATCTNLTLDLPGTGWAILVCASRYMGLATLTRLMLNLQGTNVGDPGVLQLVATLISLTLELGGTNVCVEPSGHLCERSRCAAVRLSA